MDLIPLTAKIPPRSTPEVASINLGNGEIESLTQTPGIIYFTLS
jgi:hypothetical protein